MAVSTGLRTPIHGALNVVHALRTKKDRPVAVLQFLQGDERRVLLGGVQWGLSADVDCGTEKWRWMGDTRFDIASVLHIAKRRSAHARIRITVDEQLHRDTCERIGMEGGGAAGGVSVLDERTYLLEGEFVMFVAWNVAYIADGFKVTPLARISETGVFDVIVFGAAISRLEMISVLLHVQDGSFLRRSRQYHYFKATSVEFEQISGRYLTVDGEPAQVAPFTLEVAPEDAQIRLLDGFSAPA